MEIYSKDSNWKSSMNGEKTMEKKHKNYSNGICTSWGKRKQKPHRAKQKQQNEQNEQEKRDIQQKQKQKQENK